MLKKPQVTLLRAGGIGVAEYAARTAYDSFDKSENEIIRNGELDKLASVRSSDLVDRLIWVNFHGSVSEHITLSFLIEDVGRGVLQELSRHRIQSLTVKSTRYTGSDVLIAYCIGRLVGWRYFFDLIYNLDMFVFRDENAVMTEVNFIQDHLDRLIGHHPLKVLSNEQRDMFEKMTDNKFPTNLKGAIELFEAVRACKGKRNALDPYKAIVTDNWTTSIVSTWNVRSLKNFMDLRRSGAAWEPMQELAEAMYNAAPAEMRRYLVKVDSKAS